MKKIFSLLLIATAIVAVLNACRKEFSEETFTGIDGSVKPDLAQKMTVSISGFITNENGNAVKTAMVMAGDKQTTTNEFGFFEVKDASVSKVAAFIKVVQPGYFEGYRTFVPATGSETFLRLQLIPKSQMSTINATSGGSATTTDGATVTIPANAVVLASSGAAYAGNINIAYHWINPAIEATLQNTMPGDLRGLDSVGFLRGLTTYGMMAVELTNDAGQKLQIATGKQAKLTMPIPAAIIANAPASIILWSFDETNGLWKQESRAFKIGNNYEGNVSHFSFWNCDYPYPIVDFKAQIVSEKLQGLKGVNVQIALASNPNSKAWSYTDSTGHVAGYVPANAALVLTVLNSCGEAVFTQNFTTKNAPVNLGTIVANVSTRSITVFGTAVDCNQQPISNGYLFVTGLQQVNKIAIKNGAFNYTGLTCTSNSQNANVVVVDNVNMVQSAAQSVTLVLGNNDLGKLTACGINAAEFVRFTLDGQLIEYAATDSMMASATSNGTNIYVTQVFQNNYSFLNFSFDGGTTVGNNHNLTSLAANKPKNLTAIMPNPAIKVNVTEYGAVQEFIAGSFSGSVSDTSNTTHSIIGAFRVRRQR